MLERGRWRFGADGAQGRGLEVLDPRLSKIEPTGQLEPRDEGPKTKTEISKEKKKEFLAKKAWDMATAPGKQFMMTAFMLWMMGSGVHIMNIIFTVYQLVGPIKGMLSMGSALLKMDRARAVFKPLAEPARDLGVDLTLQKLVFIACQLGVLLFITQRFASMGLLPTSASDWLGMVPIKEAMEFSTGGFPMSPMTA